MAQKIGQKMCSTLRHLMHGAKRFVCFVAYTHTHSHFSVAAGAGFCFVCFHKCYSSVTWCTRIEHVLVLALSVSEESGESDIFLDTF